MIDKNKQEKMPVLFKDAFLVKFSDKALDNKKLEMQRKSRASQYLLDLPYDLDDNQEDN